MIRRLTTLLPALTIYMMLLSSQPAQAQKYGYVNSFELLNIMPESRLADSLLQVFQLELQTLYNDYLQEYTAKSNDYSRLKDSVSAVVADARRKDLQDLEAKIKDFEASSQGRVEQRRNELFAPILQQASNLVKEVADEYGYTWIFDSSSGAIAYAPEGDNVIGLLRKKLGVEGE